MAVPLRPARSIGSRKAPWSIEDARQFFFDGFVPAAAGTGGCESDFSPNALTIETLPSPSSSSDSPSVASPASEPVKQRHTATTRSSAHQTERSNSGSSKKSDISGDPKVESRLKGAKRSIPSANSQNGVRPSVSSKGDKTSAAEKPLKGTTTKKFPAMYAPAKKQNSFSLIENLMLEFPYFASSSDEEWKKTTIPGPETNPAGWKNLERFTVLCVAELKAAHKKALYASILSLTVILKRTYKRKLHQMLYFAFTDLKQLSASTRAITASNGETDSSSTADVKEQMLVSSKLLEDEQILQRLESRFSRVLKVDIPSRRSSPARSVEF